MTFVDDSLSGSAPIRSTKSGLKSAGKQSEAAAAGQRSAFENAFADAGKKKQPMISIGAKTATETGTQAPTTVTTDAVSNGDTVALKLDKSLSVPGSAGDGEMQSAPGTTNAAFRSAAKQMPQTGEEPAIEPKTQDQTFALTPSEGKGRLLTSIGLANLGSDAIAEAGQIPDEQAGDKIKGLLKDQKLSKKSFSEASDKELQPNSQGAADAAMNTVPADVSHLLALLDAAQKPTGAGAVPAETAPALSEFQALAESAGKARVGSKDAAAAKPSARSEIDASAVDNATQAGSGQLFRFARADGKGQAVSMSLASDSDKGVVTKDAGPASTTGGKAETVTVVEARRYLGLAPTSNASTVTSQIAGNPAWANALQPSSAVSAELTEASTGKVLNTLKIQMHPIDLGTVTATLRLKDDELHVELKVETGDAFRQLSDDQGAMVKALRAQGFAVDQVSVVFNATDSSSGNNTQQQPQPQTGQQDREAAGGGPAQDRGERDNSGGEQHDSGRWTRNEGTSDASTGAELNRTGDVYM
jgi:chemotaxis protein MotD